MIHTEVTLRAVSVVKILARPVGTSPLTSAVERTSPPIPKPVCVAVPEKHGTDTDTPENERFPTCP